MTPANVGRRTPVRAVRARLAFAIFAGPVALVGLIVACSPPSDARIGIDAPNESAFSAPADLMAYRCGSLDCHGSLQRNFVIWSCDGLRLDQDAAPGCRQQGGSNTTAAEYLATFDSLVALEPAVMSQVVASAGANPDLLTFVRKARGEEDHKGGKLWDAGSPDDDCVADWLAGSGSTASLCKAALAGDEEAGTL